MDGDELWARVCATVTPLEMAPRRRNRAMMPRRDQSSMDLHGLSIHDAYIATWQFLSDCALDRAVIITGKGHMMTEFPIWADRHPRVRQIEPLNGGGAFRVKLS